MGDWVELRAKSFFSFGEGASHVHELLAQAKQLGHWALALTDTNLCGALEFARLAKSLDVQPITGGELALTDGSRVVLLAETQAGYSNISRLFSVAAARDRRNPVLDPQELGAHCEGVTLLTGGRDGPLARLAEEDRAGEAHSLLGQYLDWYGPNSVYVELQQNFLAGDTDRNRKLIRIADDAGVPLVATNDVCYHAPDRARLQHALVAAKLNTTIDQALRHLRPNCHLHLKPAAEMERLFSECPQAVSNTVRVAERCSFDLGTDLGYVLPDAAVPSGCTPLSYLEQLCRDGAVRRYGSITAAVEERLAEEFCLIERLNLAGFLLLYREIAVLAQQILVERGEIGPDTPIQDRPPGRGRGSSVALLIGYLIGISHVDPLKWNLTLERFISEDMTTLPDIDLDFPRGLRDELIERVHRHFGPDHAVLVGAIATYKAKGIIEDLGKALGLPRERLSLLSKRLGSHHAGDLRHEMTELAEFKGKIDAPRWRDLLDLAPQLMGAPRGLGQHVGGMVLSSSPIPEMVPVRAGAIDGRYIMDWDKDSVADAGFAKIDILSLPVLDQIDEALDLIAERDGCRPDLSQISPDDPCVYDMINAGLSKGVFLLQSPAQLKMAQRLKSRNLLDLAYQVALIRPGVGMQNSAVSQFVERYRHGANWDYDHPLEKRALERGCGIIVWQEQVVQLIEDVAGMTAAQADEVRRCFARPNNEHLIAMCWERFAEGARRNGVSDQAARKIFSKINGHYMFPESHSHAFAVTAYQAAWLKRYHPVEFFVALINNQPMGFYPMETLKQDARRFGVAFLNPCVNQSRPACSPESASVRLGLQLVKDVGTESARLIAQERQRQGPYSTAGDLVRRTGLKPQAVLSLVQAGAFDAIAANRREALWESGLQTRPTSSGQTALPLSTENRVPQLLDFTEYEKMTGEYRAMGIYPKGHLMELLRPSLDPHVLTAAEANERGENDQVTVAGWPVARQHPRGRDGTVFVTIEDETGDTQAIIFPDLFARRRRELNNQVVAITGRISTQDGTINLMASDIQAIPTDIAMPPTHDWR